MFRQKSQELLLFAGNDVVSILAVELYAKLFHLAGNPPDHIFLGLVVGREVCEDLKKPSVSLKDEVVDVVVLIFLGHNKLCGHLFVNDLVFLRILHMS